MRSTVCPPHEATSRNGRQDVLYRFASLIFYQYLRAVAVTSGVCEGDATGVDDDAVLTAVDTSFIDDGALPPLKCFLIVFIFNHYTRCSTLCVQQEVGCAVLVILTLDSPSQIAPPLSGLISRRVLYLILYHNKSIILVCSRSYGRSNFCLPLSLKLSSAWCLYRNIHISYSTFI